ncbi:MAG TPA: leucyl/phenylalanyl-tRNA--protein transferase [Chloroflexota bacterium]|nr:leucyl/phenylalanyl-tRNA--protein transferase [Chloroflexota bacterium]
MPRLTADLVLAAYCQGLFPMARSRRGPIEWFRPDPRAIFDPQRVHLSRRLLRTVRSGRFAVRINADFAGVIAACAAREETWISAEVERVYGELHARGFAHSVEAYQDGGLVGGLYGVAIGGAFMGESMFHRATDASKVCFAHLVGRLRERGFIVLDTQFMTEHLASLGAFYVSAAEYDRILARALRLDCRFA